VKDGLIEFLRGHLDCADTTAGVVFRALSPEGDVVNDRTLEYRVNRGWFYTLPDERGRFLIGMHQLWSALAEMMPQRVAGPELAGTYVPAIES
jgi:hypothetical protein